MLEGGAGRDAAAWLEVDHLHEQVESCLIEILCKLTDVFGRVGLPLGEGELHLGQIFKALPRVVARGAKCLENFKDLPNFGVALEEGLLVGQLEENDSNGPDVDGSGVDLGAKEDLWGSVPQGHHLVGVCLQGEAHGASEAKVRNFDLRGVAVY